MLYTYICIFSSSLHSHNPPTPAPCISGPANGIGSYSYAACAGALCYILPAKGNNNDNNNNNKNMQK